jgi:uncharacterized Rossmann fold enzyme
MQDMAAWWPVYREIAKELGLDTESDRRSAGLLGRILEGRSEKDGGAWGKIDSLVRGSNCVVFGAGPSLPVDAENYFRSSLYRNCRTFSADGATESLLSQGITPDIVVTDLDGKLTKLLKASSLGSITVAHAHGDNDQLLRNWLHLFEGPVVGTTQVEPLGLLRNYGGFTDGDRAVMLAYHHGARRIILGGMDFGDVAGRFSKPSFTRDTKASPRKLKKLAWGKRLLESITGDGSVEFYNCTSKGEDIKGYRRRTFEQMREILK